jgi:hypothetical protein
MAALALDSSVERCLFGRCLVARAARRCARQPVLERRVRIVAADARPRHTVLGVVGLLSRVATRASALSAAAHVVGLVAAGAVAVSGHVGLSQHDDVLVAASAGRGLGFLEVVGTVAPHALEVTPLEQSCRGDERLLFRMTRDAAPERLRGRRMLLLVAGRAHLVRRLAVRSVGGGDVFMAARAGT